MLRAISERVLVAERVVLSISAGDSGARRLHAPLVCGKARGVVIKVPLHHRAVAAMYP
jgi:hypothetical protein